MWMVFLSFAVADDDAAITFVAYCIANFAAFSVFRHFLHLFIGFHIIFFIHSFLLLFRSIIVVVAAAVVELLLLVSRFNKFCVVIRAFFRSFAHSILACFLLLMK